MAIELNGTTGITTPDITSSGALGVDASAPDDSLVVDSAGNVGIGTSSPSANARLTVAGTTGSGTGGGILITGSGCQTNPAGLVLGQYASNDVYIQKPSGSALSFWDNNTNAQMTLDSSGRLLVGTTSTSAPPTSTADIYAGGLLLNPSRKTAANSASAYWEASTGVFWRSTSSIRYKTNVADYTKGLSTVMTLRPVSFNPKDGDKQDRTYAGFIAEEIDALGLTEFVEYDADGLADSVGYAQITALLTKAIQEQQAIIQQQAASIDSLTARIEALEATNV